MVDFFDEDKCLRIRSADAITASKNGLLLDPEAC
jgi:hypothetical protein